MKQRRIRRKIGLKQVKNKRGGERQEDAHIVMKNINEAKVVGGNAMKRLPVLTSRDAVYTVYSIV